MPRRLLCLMMVTLLLPAAALAQGSYRLAGFDGEGSARDWSQNGFFARMEEKTGIAFTFSSYNQYDEWQKAKDQMFATGELPDALFKAALTTDEVIRYTQSGQLTDLKPLLPQYAPHLWALLTQHPDWLAAITLPGGAIGALPALQTVPTQNVLWINQEWLTKLGLPLPTDMASLRETLTAFRDLDPNGNGKKDEIPLSFIGVWELKLFSHAFGVVANDYNIYLDDAGAVRFWPQEESFLSLAAALHELYADKLLDQDGFYTSDTLRFSADDKAAVRYGAFFAPTPLSALSYDQAEAYVALPPFAWEGKRIYRDLFGPVTRGVFAITSACENPGALLAWADALYTEAGAIEAMAGKENEHYLWNADGYWQWKNADLSASELENLSVYDTGDMPWLFPQDFYGRYAEAGVRRITSELERFALFVKRPFPPYTLTPAQSADLLALQTRLGRYVDESLARLIIGETELTPQTAEAFRAGLRERGAEEMLAFWQTVADGLTND